MNNVDQFEKLNIRKTAGQVGASFTVKTPLYELVETNRQWRHQKLDLVISSIQNQSEAGFSNPLKQFSDSRYEVDTSTDMTLLQTGLRHTPNKGFDINE